MSGISYVDAQAWRFGPSDMIRTLIYAMGQVIVCVWLAILWMSFIWVRKSGDIYAPFWQRRKLTAPAEPE